MCVTLLVLKKRARAMCCDLHGKSITYFAGGLFRTVLSALFDHDTHDVLLSARKAPGRCRRRATWHGTLSILFRGQAARYSSLSFF